MAQAHRFWTIVKAALFVAAALVIARQVLASPDATGPTFKEHTADIRAALTMRLVTLPDVPSFTARGRGTLRYRVDESTAILKGESIPELVFESTGPVGDYRRFSVIVNGIPGTEPVIDWSDFPRVTFKPLDLRVRAYALSAAEVTRQTPPLMDVVFEDLSFSTDRIEVEGVEAGGYIDVEGPEAQVVAKAYLPHDSLPPYAEHLAGKPIILELLVAISNPYKK